MKEDESMNISIIRSDRIYKKMAVSKEESRNDIYRYELMKPFEFKWQCIGIPLKAEGPKGYDVVSMNIMGGGYLPSAIDQSKLQEIEKISDDGFWKSCEESIRKTLEAFEAHGIKLPVQEYVFTVLLNDPLNPMSRMTGDYCGDGGIPGYILGTIIPNEKSREMLPVALAHETNHNIRWQFVKWSQNITLADMVVSEGLAEVYAASVYGEDKIGMWVKNTSKDTLEGIIKPMVEKNLMEKDFNKISSYLYGDEIMSMRGSQPVGMPYCGGYAYGYYLIKDFLKKSGKSIYEATVMSTGEILAAMGCHEQ